MNKEKVLWKNRISVRIPIIMALVIMVVMVIMSVCLNVLTRNTVTKMTDKELDYIAQKNSKIIESYMESMLVFSQALSLEVQRYQGMERENAQELLVDSLKGVLNNDKIFSAYYAFEPDKYFPETPQGLSYYAYRDGSKVGVDIFNDFDSYSGADYYAPTKQMRSTHVTAPYPWELTNGETIWLVTLSSPIISESGEFIGVANCDLDVRSIEALEYADGGYESSFSYIITNDGTCMAHTANPDAIGDVPPIVADDKELQEAILAGNAITKEVPNPYDRGKTALAIHNPVDLPGTDVNWYSAYVINKSEAMQAVTTTSLALAGIGASGLLVLILVSGFMLKRGLAPINQVMALAEKMGNCDLSSRENALVHTNDELGLLSCIFQDTSETLGSYIRQISEALDSISSGNLDFAIEQDFIGDFNQIKRDLNEIIDNLNRTFREMMVAAEQVATGAEQFSDGSQVMSQGAIEQASAIEELSEKITEITGQVEESARNAGQANGQAEQVNLELAASDSQMQQLLGAMSAIKDTSAQIGNIIKTIEDIAFQTNILALNAAVEAARAGEAGKGFAVVADEVRNLASKSAEAAKNTTVLIESAMASVQEGANFAEVTADSLAKLAEGTKQIIAAVAEISGKTENQFSSLKEVTDGIDQISTVVQKNAATAEESAATSEELSAQAQLLKEQIARFRLKNQ